MKVNGFKLREAIKRMNLRIDTLDNVFDASVSKFAQETKKPLKVIGGDLVKAEIAACELQTALSRFNLDVKIDVESIGKISIDEAVKRIGYASRMEKKWRTLAAPKRDRYERHPDTSRSREADYAVPTFTVDEAMQEANTWARLAGNLRAAIAVGNATTIEVAVNPELFE